MGNSPHLTVMINAAKKASRQLLRDFGEVENLQVSQKGPGDFVSNADRRAEETIFNELKQARPDWNILGEESGAYDAGKGSEYRFVVDPLDGTTNFLHGFPYWSISIGLEKAGVPIAGVVMAPVFNEIFHAERGAGAFLNDRRIRVSSRKNLNESFIASGSPSSYRRVTKSPINILQTINKITPKVGTIRCVNSAALDLAYLAAGKFDAIIDHSLKQWDMSAGIIIVKEAGGKVTDVAGGETYYQDGDIVATNYHLHENLIGLLSAAN